MSLEHAVHEAIREIVGVPKGVPFNPLAALKDIAKRMLALYGAAKALAADRHLMRMVLCAIAWDFGQYEGKLPDLLLLQWPPDPEPEEEKKVQTVKPGLVSLH